LAKKEKYGKDFATRNHPKTAKNYKKNYQEPPKNN
jgi:hypothetical protein